MNRDPNTAKPNPKKPAKPVADVVTPSFVAETAPARSKSKPAGSSRSSHPTEKPVERGAKVKHPRTAEPKKEAKSASSIFRRPAPARKASVKPQAKESSIVNDDLSARTPQRHAPRRPAPSATPYRSQKELSRELLSLRNELKRHVKGKPSKASYNGSLFSVFSKGIWRLAKIAVLLVVLLVLFVGSTGAGMLLGYISSATPIPAELLKAGTQTSKMLDKDGQLIAKFTGSKNIDREPVSLEDVENTYITYAFIAIEDERFATNIGIDPQRIGSALFSALVNGGVPTHGGSTITQQVVKLTTGNDKRSAQRKFQEWYRAILLNQSLTKKEIMNLYINLVPMGNSFVGIQSAAMGYFGKNAKDLTLAESAYLAGMPRGPSLYNPYTETGLRNGLRRQRIVLSKLYSLGYISRGQYQRALNTELQFKLSDNKFSATSILPYFVEYCQEEVITDLMERKNLSYSLASHLVSSGGLTIHSTLEPSVQQIVDKAFTDESLYRHDPEVYENLPAKPQAGQVVINNSTGAIAAMRGGFGEKKGNYLLNRAVDIRRQPGSSIKPLAVYAPGINEYKITGASVFDDKPMKLDPKNPDVVWPQNFGNYNYGRISARNALKISLNIEPVLIIKSTGVSIAKEYLKAMGIDRTDDPVEEALALGALYTGVSPLQMASAYATFANGGKHPRHHSYSKVINNEGDVILSNEIETTEVFRPQVAYMTTMLLRETMQGVNSSFPQTGLAYRYGELYNENGELIPLSAKSGTTENAYDHWFCGFTPYYSSAVWYGLDKPSELSYPYTAEDLFFNTMRAIHKNAEAKNFTQPEGIVVRQVCNQSGLLANSYCGYHIQDEYFEENSPMTPTYNCNIHGAVAPTPTSKPSDGETAPTPAPEQTQPTVPTGNVAG